MSNVTSASELKEPWESTSSKDFYPKKLQIFGSDTSAYLIAVFLEVPTA